MSSLSNRLSGLIFTSTELKALTGWDDRVVEDYLSLVDSLKQVADNATDSADLTLLQAQVDALELLVNAHISDASIHFLESSISHLNIQDIGSNTHAQIDSHIADGSIHFTVGSIDHTLIQNIGTNTHAQIDAHIADGSIHFTEASIDHTAIQNIGVNTHAQIDSHIADATIHFTVGSIDHTLILNVGTNTHAQIDAHIADATIHFTVGSIDHTLIQNVGVNTHAQIDAHIADTSNPHQVTLQQAYDAGQTIATSSGQVSIDNTGQTEAGLRVVPNATFPTTNLSGGQMHIDTDGTLYVYDSTRSKWLSTGLVHFAFSSNGATDNEYLRIGNMFSTQNGYKMPFDGTIVAITATTRTGNTTKGFDVEINGTAQISFNLVANEYEDTTEDTNFAAGDDLRVFCVAAGAGVQDPVVSIFVKWRK